MNWQRLLGSHKHQVGFIVIVGMLILVYSAVAARNEIATQIAALISTVSVGLGARRAYESRSPAPPQGHD